jgi:multiple sugar transport system ATP-binding protein
LAGIRFQRIGKRFGTVEAVSDLSLDVTDREFLVLLGPSGCGKTTALRMLAGLETPSTGRIFLGGRDITEVPARDRDLAMVFQNYALYPHMSVYDNISFGLRLRRVAKAEIRRRVERVAEMLQIADLLARKPKELSGGQRQRVALGRAIVRDPQAFLMDEPLSNLDAQLRTGTRAELARLHRELQATFIYVTHDQVEAMTMATRIAVMAEARLQQVGTPVEVYDRPATTFVAQFIGTPPMNLFPAELRQEAGAVLACAPHLRVRLGGGSADRREVYVGVRPEHLRPAAGDADPVHPWFQASVRAVEMLGNELIVLVEVGGTTGALRAPRTLVVAPGDRLRLTCTADQVHLFDRGSGRRLEFLPDAEPGPAVAVPAGTVDIASR